MLPAERRRFLATMGRRLTPQALERRDPQRRYPILLTVLAQSGTDVLDEVVALFDQAISAKFGAAARRMQQELAERGKSGEDRQALLDDLLAILTDPAVADEEIGALIRGEKIGWERLQAAIAQAKPRLPLDHGHLAALDSSYNYLRQFTPAVLASVGFAGGTAATELLIAVAMLRERNATGRRKVFDEAPTGFVPTKWRGYLDQARKSGDTTGNCACCSGCATAAQRGRVRTREKSTTARPMSRYFAGEGLSTYTHVTDQHTTYGTKVIVATKREAHYVLDEILVNATDLPITEHATDTPGVTLVNFGLFDPLGTQLPSQIRDLGRITLYRPGPRGDAESRFPHAGPLMTCKANVELIAEHWDDLLRLAGSLKFGHATASLLVGKLSASVAPEHPGRGSEGVRGVRRTICAVKYLADPDYRRKASRQLNKGESLHALRRDLLYAHEGMIRARQLVDQTEQA